MKRLLVLLAVAAVLLSAPGVAWAAAPAPAAPASSSGDEPTKGTPATPELVDIQLWPEDVKGSMTVIVAAVLPASAKLPASVTLPLPKDARVTWVGEIFETTEQDVPRKAQTAADGTSLTVITSKSRVVQYEAQYSAYSERGGRRYAVLEWVQNAPASKVQFAFRLPAFASDVKSSPKFDDVLGPNANGEKMYSLSPRPAKAGERFKLAVDYVPRAVQALPPVSKQGPDVLLISIGGLLAVAIAALAVVVVRSRGTTA